ncbi:MAG: alpha/beta hydrolase [Pseudomonadota bacterium]
MPSEIRAGYRTYWDEEGEGARWALLIHPSLASSRIWTGVRDRVTLRTIAFDQPGHGQSAPWDRKGDFHDQATAVAASFLTADPVDLVGHSFGATIALRLALEHPKVVRSLTLIEPVLFIAAKRAGDPEFDRHMERMEGFDAALALGDYARAARTFDAVWGSGAPWETLPEAVRAKLVSRIPLIAAGEPVLLHDTRGLLDAGRLERLSCPVHFLRGDASPPIIAAIHAALRARLAQSDEAVIPGAAHMLTATHPQETAAKLNAWLGG